MSRICRPGIVRLVAGVARGRQIIEVVVRMALHACERGVEARQRIICVECVIEARHRGPHQRGSAMARITRSRESGGDVTWIRRTGEVCLMAAITGGRNGGVVVVGVAQRAGECGVRTYERKY